MWWEAVAVRRASDATMQYDVGWAQRTSKSEVWVAEAACRAGEGGGGDDGRTTREGRGASGGKREGYDACRGGGGEEVKKHENNLGLGEDAGERDGPFLLCFSFAFPSASVVSSFSLCSKCLWA